MIVISYGVEKSGSTLAFEMTKAVLELHGFPQVRLPDGVVNDAGTINEVGPWSDDRLRALVEHTAGMCIAVRTHHPPGMLSSPVLLGQLSAGAVKIHVTFRDPRDTVLAMLDDAVRARAFDRSRHNDVHTIDDALALLSPRLESLRRWGAYPSLKLEYDDFAFDRRYGPQLIADDLGIDTDPEAVWNLVDRRFTRKNVARPRRHLSEMSDDDRARVREVLGDYVDFVDGRRRDWF